MEHLFYIIGIPFLIYELTWILNPTPRVDSSYKLFEITKNKKWDDHTDEEKKFLLPKIVFSFYTLIWLILGLFTWQWPLFISQLLLNLGVVRPLSKLAKPSRMWFTALHWVDSLIGLLFAIFVILNKYHLRIDVWQVVQNWF